jgi:hypothetical protein
MLARGLLLSLSVGAALADAAGLQRLGFLLVLAAIIAAATQALTGYWELAREPEGFDGDVAARAQGVLSAIVVVLLVVSAAVRAPSLLQPGVPALAASALAGALAFQAFQIALYLAAEARRRVARRPGVPVPR